MENSDIIKNNDQIDEHGQEETLQSELGHGEPIAQLEEQPSWDQSLAQGQGVTAPVQEQQQPLPEAQALLKHQTELWLGLQEEYHLRFVAKSGNSCCSSSSSSDGSITRQDWIKQRSVWLAREVVCVCFQDHTFNFTVKRGVSIGHIDKVLVWWVHTCLCDCVDNEFTPKSHPSKWTCNNSNDVIVDEKFLGRLHPRMCSFGQNALERLRALVRDRRQRQAHQQLPERLDALTMEALEQADQLTVEQFEDVFGRKHKQLRVVLQATIAIVLFIRNDGYICHLQHLSIPDFVSTTVSFAAALVVPKNKRPDFNVDDVEMANLFYTCNMMKILSTFLPREKTKGLFMDICSQVIERRPVETGGGRSLRANTREAIYAVVSGTRPTRRPRAAAVRPIETDLGHAPVERIVDEPTPAARVDGVDSEVLPTSPASLPAGLHPLSPPLSRQSSGETNTSPDSAGSRMSIGSGTAFVEGSPPGDVPMDQSPLSTLSTTPAIIEYEKEPIPIEPAVEADVQYTREAAKTPESLCMTELKCVTDPANSYSDSDSHTNYSSSLSGSASTPCRQDSPLAQKLRRKRSVDRLEAPSPDSLSGAGFASGRGHDMFPVSSIHDAATDSDDCRSSSIPTLSRCSSVDMSDILKKFPTIPDPYEPGLSEGGPLHRQKNFGCLGCATDDSFDDHASGNEADVSNNGKYRCQRQRSKKSRGASTVAATSAGSVVSTPTLTQALTLVSHNVVDDVHTQGSQDDDDCLFRHLGEDNNPDGYEEVTSPDGEGGRQG